MDCKRLELYVKIILGSIGCKVLRKMVKKETNFFSSSPPILMMHGQINIKFLRKTPYPLLVVFLCRGWMSVI
jgi:uncharacterized membrane protein YcaP (DUF421 family)